MTNRPTPPCAITDTEVTARWGHVSDLIATATTRPGAAITVAGPFVFTETVNCIHRNVPVDMEWEDHQAADMLARAVNDPTIPLAALADHTHLAAAATIIRNDVHELFEHLRYNDRPVVDPHPNNSRHPAPTVDVTVTATLDPDNPDLFARRRLSEPVPRAHATSPSEHWIELDGNYAAGIARPVIAELNRSTAAAGGRHRFAIDDEAIIHTAQYPDRDTGIDTDYTWSVPVLADLCVPDTGDRAAATRSMIVSEAIRIAVGSIVHKVAEWLHFAGTRVYDPHPRFAGGTLGQIDRLRPRLSWNASPLI